MTTAIPSDDSSSNSGSDQERYKHQKFVFEPGPDFHKELDHPQHEIVADIDTERDVEIQPEKEKSTSKTAEKDPNLVTWNSVDDPANPRNWSFKRKWAAVFVVSSFTFISPVSSSMVAPALGIMKTDLGIAGDFEAAMILSIFVLSYAIGPLIFGPLSEVYGRVRVLQYSNLIYLIFNFVCGFAKNGPQMLAFRFFSGLGGSALLALGGGILSDTFDAEHRGQAIGLYSLAPLLGPAVGPIAGGFITENTTWRWVFWSTTIFCAAVQISGLLFMQGMFSLRIISHTVLTCIQKPMLQLFFSEKQPGCEKRREIRHCILSLTLLIASSLPS
jgi:multidrug resistance protein